MEAKNKLVIIGNGFDLAHGLKTSYNDFISWLLRQILEGVKTPEKTSISGGWIKRSFNVITIQFKGYVDIPANIGTNKGIVDFFENHSNISVLEISPFFKKLLNTTRDYSWVDIETEYYKALIGIYESVNKNTVAFVGTEYEYYLSEINKLNTSFEFIKHKLEEYLSTFDCDMRTVFKNEINNLFKSDFSREYHSEESKKQIHYLNFNYTNTIEKYILPQSNYQLNYIHGKLNTKDNPLIFGYGDEIDSYYEKIEHLNINEFLNNFKSFGYFKTENYGNLLRFINSEPYEIEILGHSCGLSDRVLLNTIFEHDNCQSIKIHYYEKNETENDFMTKTQEISRHFKDKAKMRARIVDFTKCKPLVKYKG